MKPKFRAGIDDPQIFFEEEFMAHLYDHYPINNNDVLLHYMEDGTYFENWFQDKYPDEWEADNKAWEEHKARVKKIKEANKLETERQAELDEIDRRMIGASK
jgi:lipopolysaccharide biosynthesis glycosyltransferase